MEAEIKDFSISKVEPAFAELGIELEELKKYGLEVQIDLRDIHAQRIVVRNLNSKKEFNYTIQARISSDKILIDSHYALFKDKNGVRPHKPTGRVFDISKGTKEDIVQDFVNNIKQNLKDFVK